MCGIAAAYALGHVEPGALREIAARLARAVAHRGPDGEGLWEDGAACALAHRRLAVIDLSPAAAQPMRDATGRYALTYNGELYNFRELRGELAALGHSFRSQSDTEVLLAAYAQWRDAAFARFDGMFALAVYDTLERRLLLARDRAGEKPLFYASLDGVLVVASELRAIASLPQLQRTLDARGVFDYLALRYVPAPRSILEGVHALEPGTLLAFAPGRAPHKRAFFAFDRVVDPAPRPEEETTDELESTLAQSLERRLIADVPLGAFLSSGIDSSLVCALGARKLGREIRTFCAGFAGGAEDETAAASRIARALGLPHTRYTISSDDLVRTVRDFGPCLDEPNGDRSCVPVYLLAREMRREATVALSGDGGDELFCGYERYAGFDKLREGLAAADSIEAYFERALPVFPPSTLKTLLPEEYRAWQAEFLPLYAPVALRSGWTEAQRLSVLDFHTYMPGAVLAKVDRMSMRHALEVRTPFLEPRVMELAAGLPRSLAPAAGSLKPALRRLLRRYLDEALIAPRKIGFGMPASFMQAHGEIFRRMLDAACETLRATEFFRARPAVLDRLAALAPGNGNSLWALTVLGMWCEANGLARAR